MYKLSFVMCLICTVLTFFINGHRLWLVFIVQMLYAITIVFYYIPSEVATMSKNTKGQMKKFMGLNSALAVFASVLSPFLSGYIIDYVSYQVLFGIMIACTVVCFILSTRLNLVINEIEHISMKQYCSIARKDKAIVYGYTGYSINKFSQDGPIETLLPILLFMRTGTNYSVGIYFALAALIASIALLLYSYFVKKKSIGMWINSACQVIASICILISNSIIIFFIYYFTIKIVGKLLHNDTNSSIFTIVNHTELYKYKVEQHFAYHTISAMIRVLSCGLCLLFYNFLNYEISISLFLAITASFQLLSTWFICKSDKMLRNAQLYTEKLKIEGDNET